MAEKTPKKELKENRSWIENVCGTFENDQLYEEAMKLGKQSRKKINFSH
jgi:hypothetical protein